MIYYMHKALDRLSFSRDLAIGVLTLVTGKSALVTAETLFRINWPLSTCVPAYKKLPVWMRVYELLNAELLSWVLGI
jgi:hypothetical protein